MTKPAYDNELCTQCDACREECCDCEDRKPEFIGSDIGVLASKDAVAIDQATIDLIGVGSFKGDPGIQVREAHRLGLGELEYEIYRV
ncbi:MAG: hypothetical protein ACXQTW_05805 [Candidatus Methanospirareceae archaeon]